jgi:hypothetical protein
MKKIITISCFCISFVSLFFILGTQTACQKQSTNCPCTITVKDTNGNAVSSALVRLYAPNSTAGALGLTNLGGTINFNFSLPAVYSITAVKALGPNDTLKGTGIIQLQIGQTVSTTVTAK